MPRDSLALQRRACAAKKVFNSKADAKRFLRLHQRRHLIECSGQRPYLCPWCGYFHLGHPSPYHHEGGTDG